MKKALTLLLTLCLIASVCALPVSAVSIPFNSTNIEITDAAQGTIRVSGVITNDSDPVLENKYVTILVLPSGSAPSAYASALAMSTATADLDGKFSTTFTFNQTGNFSFYAIYENYTSARADFEIKGTASAAAIVKNIHNGSIAEGSIAPAIASHGQMGVDLTRFPLGFDRNLFEYRIYTNRADIDVTGTDAQVLASFYELVDFAAAEAEFVKNFNNTTYVTAFITLMRENAAYMKGLSFAAYDALSDEGKIYVQNSFMGKTYYNADQIVADFNLAVANAPQGSTGVGGGAGAIIPPSGDREFGGEMVDNSANTTTATFTDIADVPWAKEAIEALAAKGIVAGTSYGIFEPNGNVTREQFAKMLVLATGTYNSSAVNDFTDVPSGDWSAPYVASAKEAGFVKGIGEGKFGYGASITREDMAVMIYNVMKSYDPSLQDIMSAEFDDFAEISDYAKEAVGCLVYRGIINGVGDNKFAPKATATRAQAALLVYAIVKGVA